MRRAIAAAVLVGLVACGGGGDVGTEESSPATTVAPATTAAPPTTAAPATSSSTTAPADSTTTTAGSSGPGGYDYDYGDVGGDSPPTTAAPEASGSGATINISGFDFGRPVTVSAGETVEVVNNDAVGHTFTSTDGAFDSGTIGGNGGTFELTLEEPGEYRFTCAIHPTMQGTLTVEG